MNYDQSWMTEKKTQKKKMKINGMASIPVHGLELLQFEFFFSVSLSFLSCTKGQGIF